MRRKSCVPFRSFAGLAEHGLATLAWAVSMPLIAGCLVAGCAASASDSARAGGASDDKASAGGTGASGSTSGAGVGGPGIITTPGGGDAGVDNLPPEKEIRSSFKAPVATAHYVWSANAASGKIALIDPQSLSVKLVEAGNAPTYLVAIPGAADDKAAVINVLSHDASILSASGGSPPTATTVPVATDCNSWAVSPDGKWAIAWTNVAEIERAVGESESFQEISIVNLGASPAKSSTLAVGYRPSQILFAAGRAYVISADGVSVVDLTTASVEKTIRLDPQFPVQPTDVSITPDGAWAVVREDKSSHVLMVKLDLGAEPARTTYTLSGVVTDVDLSDHGDRAVAVARATSEIAILPVPPQGAGGPTSVTTPSDPEAGATPAAAGVKSFAVSNSLVGSVEIAPGGAAALFYTNAVPLKLLTYVPLDAPEMFRLIAVHSPIQSVQITSDGQHAIVLHDTSIVGIDSPSDVSTLPEGGKPAAAPAGAPQGAFSLVPLAKDNPPRIESTIAPIMSRGVAVTAKADHVLIVTRDPKGSDNYVYVADLPSLQVTPIKLASRPLSVGVVGNRGFVAQEAPEGRIAVIDLDLHVARTLTGFELNSQIIDGTGSP